MSLNTLAGLPQAIQGDTVRVCVLVLVHVRACVCSINLSAAASRASRTSRR